MTWTWGKYYGGETLDSLIEGGHDGTSPLSASWSCNTAQKVTGVASLYAVDAGAGLAPVTCSNSLDMIQGWFRVGGNPSVAGPFLGHNVDSGDFCYLELGTDRRLRFRSYNDVNGVRYSPWSVGTLASSGWTHITLIIDRLTLGINHTLGILYIDKLHEMTWDTGGNHYGTTFGKLGTGVTEVDLYVDDLCGAVSTTATDAPHLATIPVGKVLVQHPASDTADNDWTRSSGAGTWASHWDDGAAGANDGDTTYLSNPASPPQHQYSTMQSRATVGIPAGATICHSAAGKGPAHSFVHRVEVGGTKYNVASVTSLSAGVGQSNPGTTYVGIRNLPLRTGGGSWAPADLDSLTAGFYTTGTHDMVERVTSQMIQWLYTDESLPLAPAPMIPQGSVV